MLNKPTYMYKISTMLCIRVRNFGLDTFLLIFPLSFSRSTQAGRGKRNFLSLPQFGLNKQQFDRFDHLKQCKHRPRSRPLCHQPKYWHSSEVQRITNNLPVACRWFLCSPLDLQGQQKATRWESPSRCLRHNGERKMPQNQIRKAVWAGWRVFVQERGFISGKHSQEVRFGIVHPIPAFHRKPCIKSNWKRPKTFHMSPVDSPGAPRFNRAGFYSRPSARAWKETCAMEESFNPQVRRLAPPAAAQPARAHAPDDPILRG